MAKTSRTYRDGEIIFREGESCDFAYEILSGNVELTKRGPDGPVRLGLLGRGEIFGEMGLLGRGGRTSSAQSMGATTVRFLTRDDFAPGADNTAPAGPAQPRGTNGWLKRLLRRLIGLPANGPHQMPDTPPPAAALPIPDAPAATSSRATVKPVPQRGDMFQNVLDRLGSRDGRMEVRIATLDGDDGDAMTRRVLKALAGRKGLLVKTLGRPLNLAAGVEPETALAQVTETARAWIEEADADLLIWGHVPSPGVCLHLHFVARTPWDENLAGAFDPRTDLALPANLDGRWADFLHAAVLAAIVPATDTQAAARVELLADLVERADSAMSDLPMDLTVRERAGLHICQGHLLAVTGGLLGGDLSERALNAYRTALSLLGDAAEPLEEVATIHKHMGALLQNIAMQRGDPSGLREAADVLRLALDGLSREHRPLDWAATQNRLALALYRQDPDDDEIERLKQALTAFKHALQIYTRADAPSRWAEILSNFAQVAQVLGRELKSPEALEQAVKASRSALKVRKKGDVPMLWAMTQNNLGSALFMLGNITGQRAHLVQAAEAFDLALGVYEARNAKRRAAITRKNLDRVAAKLADRVETDIPRLDWEDDQAQPAIPAAGLRIVPGGVDIDDIGSSAQRDRPH